MNSLRGEIQHLGDLDGDPYFRKKASNNSPNHRGGVQSVKMLRIYVQITTI